MDRSLQVAGPLDRVGEAPLVRLRRVIPDGSAWVLARWSGTGPGGSASDAVARALVEAAEAEGRLRRGDTIVEAVSGPLAGSLALVGAARGYRVMLVMPESVEAGERVWLEHLGAEVELTPAEEGQAGAEELVAERIADHSDWWRPEPRRNPANLAYHRQVTAEAILRDTSGRVDAFVAGVATGGTISGVGSVLKARLTGFEVVAAEIEPAGEVPAAQIGRSAVREADGGSAVLDRRVIDATITVTEDEARDMAGRLARLEGLPVGRQAGANVAAALAVASRLGLGRVVVTTLPDSAARWFGPRPA